MIEDIGYWGDMREKDKYNSRLFDPLESQLGIAKAREIRGKLKY